MTRKEREEIEQRLYEAPTYPQETYRREGNMFVRNELPLTCVERTAVVAILRSLPEEA